MSWKKQLSLKEEPEGVLDWICMGAGALLLISPFAMGYSGDTPALWHAIILGLAIGVLAIWSLIKLHEWEEWARLVVGAWVVVAPWTLGFASIAAATWTHVVLGAATALFSAWRLWEMREHPQTAT